jgi:hypothetical protein
LRSPRTVLGAQLEFPSPERAEFSAGCRWQPLPLPEVDLVVDLVWRTRDGHDPGPEWLRELIVATAAGACVAALSS